MSALALPSRLLMGPGPSNVHPRVREALAAPVLGHLDPLVLAMLTEIQEKLRVQFGTAHPLTLAVSGTGSAGIESCLAGLIESGDRVVVEVRGFFGERMAEMAARAGGQVTRVESPWGQPADLDHLRETCRTVRPRILAVVHAETSTGVGLPLEQVAAIAREVDAELVVDCVTSLGGMPVEIDRYGITAAASCSQKCLGAPPGLSPVTVSPRAEARIAARRQPTTFYLDLPLIAALLGQRSRLPPHDCGQPDLRAARGAHLGGRRGSGRAPCAPCPARHCARARSRSAGPRDPGSGRQPDSDADRGAGAGAGVRRSRHSPPSPDRLQSRDRGRASASSRARSGGSGSWARRAA